MKTATGYNYNVSDVNTWTNGTSTTNYYSTYTYDKNGNFTNLQRNGVSPNTTMDNFTYNYVNVSGQPSNRLGYVDDVASTYTDDIDDQGSGNYIYDNIGQLVRDVSEQINTLAWRYGDKKLASLTRTNGSTKDDISYVYNPLGQRVLKIVMPRTAGGAAGSADNYKYWYYAYDANGQVMAVYELTKATGNNTAYLREQHLYGASRVGMIKPDKSLYVNAPISTTMADVNPNTFGRTYYEISNYLGNVNAVITDRKIWNSPSTGVFNAVVVSTADYYAFGMDMPGRSTNLGNYRYLYNGMEVDKEVSGDGNSYSTEFRQYDPRLGRWKSLDPVFKPNESPYASNGNNPVWFIDPNGADSIQVNDKWFWEVESGDHYGTISQRTGVSVKDLKKYNDQNPTNLTSCTLLNLDSDKTHFVYRSLTPSIYNLTVSALALNPSWSTLTWSGVKEEYAANRSLACPRGSCPSGVGLSCDEFPYASSKEGGSLAMTECVPIRENQVQGGQLSQLYRGMKPGQKYNVVPFDGGPDREPVYKPVPVPVEKPINKPLPMPYVWNPSVKPIPALQPVSPTPTYSPQGGSELPYGPRGSWFDEEAFKKGAQIGGVTVVIGTIIVIVLSPIGI